MGLSKTLVPALSKFIKLLLQKDTDDDNLLSGEDVRTCLSLSSINISPSLVSRLLKSSLAGDKKHSIETIAFCTQKSHDLISTDTSDRESEAWKYMLDLYRNLPR